MPPCASTSAARSTPRRRTRRHPARRGRSSDEQAAALQPDESRWAALRALRRHCSPTATRGLFTEALGVAQLARLAHALPALRRGDRRRARRLGAALPGGRQPGLPAHRPGGDRAASPTPTTGCCSAPTRCGRTTATRCSPASSNRGSRSRRPCMREVYEESGLRVADPRLPRVPAVAVPGLAHGRLHRATRRRPVAGRARARRRGDPRPALVQPRRARAAGDEHPAARPLVDRPGLIDDWLGGPLRRRADGESRRRLTPQRRVRLLAGLDEQQRVAARPCSARSACSPAPEPARPAPSPTASPTASTTGAYSPNRVMALTFTARAAAELRGRLRAARRRRRRRAHLPRRRALAAQLLLAARRRRQRAAHRSTARRACSATPPRCCKLKLDTADAARPRRRDRVAQGLRPQHRAVRRGARAARAARPARRRPGRSPCSRPTRGSKTSAAARLRGRAAGHGRHDRARAVASPCRCASSTASSSSTSTRTSRRCSTTCSTSGSATAATSASSATPARPSTRSPAPAATTCSTSRSATRMPRSCASSRTTGRRRPIVATANQLMRGRARRAHRCTPPCAETGAASPTRARRTRPTWPRPAGSPQQILELDRGRDAAARTSPCSTASTCRPRRSRRRSATSGVSYLIRGSKRFFDLPEVKQAVMSAARGLRVDRRASRCSSR